MFQRHILILPTLGKYWDKNKFMCVQLTDWYETSHTLLPGYEGKLMWEHHTSSLDLGRVSINHCGKICDETLQYPLSSVTKHHEILYMVQDSMFCVLDVLFCP